MTSDSDSRPSRRPRITIALPNGALRDRLLEALQKADVDLDVVDAASAMSGVEQAEGDIVLLGPGQVRKANLDELGEVARSDDEAGLAVVGEDDPAKRAKLVAAGFSSVLSTDQSEADLAASLEALAAAEAEGGVGGPEVGGAGVEPRLADFLTRSPRMQEFVELVRRVIPADTTLLILGPTGVGKEHLARAIHGESTRAKRPFVTVNCAALPEQLLEAELFGHAKGAFTGAERARKGRFELANRGTLFLDEIGEMPLHLQAKLLTVLQRHEVTPIGSDQPIRVDVRVVVATNRDLQEEVAARRFREDLFFRLNVVPLEIPALAARADDIPELVGRFIQHFRATMPVSNVTAIADDALELLMHYSWPGNIRELINVIERAMLLGRGTRIECADLPAAVTGGSPGDSDGDEAGSASAATSPLGPSLPRSPAPDLDLEQPIKATRERAVANAERAYLDAALRRTGGQVGEVAKIAGISPRALYEKMKRYELRKEDYRG